jgi:GINS complex subunit 4
MADGADHGSGSAAMSGEDVVDADRLEEEETLSREVAQLTQVRALGGRDGDVLGPDRVGTGQAWISEKLAPCLLAYESEAVTLLQEQVENQQENIDDGSLGSVQNAFIGNLYQIEVDRVRYLLRSYHRVRLQKLQTFVVHILKTPSER